MPTTHHQVVGKRNSSEAGELTGENTLGRETLCFFRKVASAVAEVGVSVSADLGKSSTKNAKDCSGSEAHLKRVKSTLRR